jgi:DNA-binding CsgD family transcriptional regulator/tetratricopeptide (TPR) repeat protein
MASRGSRGGAAKQRDLFVGRQSEVALISRLLDGVKAGKGIFIGISGEPGIGKTRLAEAAVVRARAKGFSAFWGQCHDGQYIPPYWPWKEPLRGLLKMLAPARGKAGQDRFAAGLAGIVSEGFEVSPATRTMPKPVSHQARLMILESTVELIRTASKRMPVLLVMDNIHCADVPSLQLLEVAAREMRGSRVAMIGSYREPAADSPAEFRPAIGALASQDFFHGIALSGWDLAAVSEYLAACGIAEVPAELARAVLDRTEGNPLFVGEVARLLEHDGLLEGGSVHDVRAWETHIPQKVRLAILGQVQRLSPACRDAMSFAALAGREFESVILAEAADAGRTAAEKVLEEAITRGLVMEDRERPGLYKFTHALVQDVLIEQLPAPRRSAYHLKIGEALERHSPSDLETRAGELARHFDKAGPEASARAASYYRIAGERALKMHGFEDALEQLGHALRLEKGKENPLQTARLFFGLAQSLHGMGRFENSVEHYTRAFELFRQAGDFDNAIRMLEQPLILAEKGAHATGLLGAAIALAGPGSLRAEALLGKYGLAVYHDTGDYRKAAALFDRALLSARESRDRAQEMSALVNRGRIECDELHFEDAHRLEQEAYRLALEDQEVWIQLMSQGSDFLSLLGLGRLAEGEGLTQNLHALSERVHIRLWTALISSFRFALLRQKGLLTAARENNDRALLLGEGPYTIWNLADRALVDFELGDSDNGARTLRQVEKEARSADSSMPFHWEGWLTVLVSLIAWVTGEHVALEDAESAAQALLARGGLRKGDAVHVHAGLGLISVMRKDGEAAKEHYVKLLPFGGLVICPYQGIPADHILALLASTIGDRAAARGHFDAALAFCRDRGLTLELAYTCRDCAEFLLAGGGRHAASAAVLCQEAEEIARRCGLPRLIERVDEIKGQLLPRTSVSPAYPDALSEREVEVIRLLAEGLSNALIGDKLFISPYTVANHVQKILEKTGSANRTEAAIYAVRHRLLEPETNRE